MNDASSKPFYASRTFWTALVVAATPAVSAAFPPFGAWLSVNADLVCTGLAAVFGALRLVTEQPVK